MLSLGFVLSAQADSIPSINKWYDCQDKLEKQKIENKDRLCSDKYAKKISKSNNYSTDARLHRQWRWDEKLKDSYWVGKVNLNLSNISNNIVITKIAISGKYKCKDSNGCYTTFKDDFYVFVEPKTSFPPSTGGVIFDDFVITDAMWDAYETWSFNITVYGFKIDY